MLFKHRQGQHALAVGGLEHRARCREGNEELRRHIVDFFHRIEQQVAVQAHAADPDHIGLGLFDTGRDGTEITVAKLPLQVNGLGQATLFHGLTRALGDKVHRGKFAGQHGHGFGRFGARGHGIEHQIGPGALDLVGLAAHRKQHVVFGQGGQAKGVVQQQFAVALGNAHGRQNIGRGVGAHQQVDLVHGDQLLVQGARHIGLGLVVFEHPLHWAAQPTTAFVELFEVNLASDFLHHCRGTQGACECQ